MGMRHIGCVAVVIVTSMAWLGNAAQAVYMTGFEPPAYSSGPLALQDGWAVTGGTTEGRDLVRVRTASEIANELTAVGLTSGQTVGSGTQAMLNGGPGAGPSAIQLLSALNSASRVIVDFSARPLFPATVGTVGTAQGNVFLAVEGPTGGIAAGVRFGIATVDDAQVRTVDYYTNVTGGWVPTAVNWDGDTWFDFTIDIDHASQTYDFFIDGNPMNVAPIAYGSAVAQLGRVRIFRGTNQAGAIWDDLAVAIPEPSMMASLLLLGGGLILRRRK